MKINISKNDLSDAINTVFKGISSRSTLPILAGMLLEAKPDGTVTFQTTDLEISIRHTAVADVVESGKTVLPGKLFSDIVKTLPDAAVGIDSDESVAHIDCLGSSFTLSTLNATDFPYFPEVSADTVIELDPASLEKAVLKVSRAVSKDESRAILTGVLFSVEEGKVRLAATDSYRLAVANMPLESGGSDGFQAVVPGRTFEDVARLASSEKSISIGFSENQIVFSFGSTTFVSRKIEGTYPNYKQLIPPSHEVTVRLDTKEFTTAIKRVSLLAQSHTPVKLSFSSEAQQVTVSAKTQDVGGASEVVEAVVEGEDIEIAFNHQYLLDGLNAVEGDAVLELQTPLKPGIMKSSEEDGFIYLAMPVRLS